jgi:hypothetical protein
LKNWSTRDDVRSLAAWQRLFGPGFRALFVFAYEVRGDRAPLAAEQLFNFRGRLYAFLGLGLDHYVYYARPISAAWDTLSMPTSRFRQLVMPLDAMLRTTDAAGCEASNSCPAATG